MILSWTELKPLIAIKTLKVQYIKRSKKYIVWVNESNDKYECYIDITTPPSTEQLDFENNYKDTSNQPITLLDKDGKQYVRSDSRPLNMTTYFTMSGDSATVIGDGKELKWDFANTTDDVATPPIGFKRKRIEYTFLDIVRIKEGSIYWQNKLFGSYIDLYIVCPNGQVYLDNNKSPIVATVDTPVDHFVNKHFLMGTVLMGDELNTESASSEIPNNYKFWLEITVPDTDVTSKGYVSMELYRSRTVIL